MKTRTAYLLSLVVALMLPLSASAIRGTYSDPGGGTYKGDVYVHDIAAGKSYGWCTGDDENAKMEEFRGFECENNGKVTTQNPWIFIKFRYHKTQSKRFNFKSSTQKIYVKLKSGMLQQIAEANFPEDKDKRSWSQWNKSWGLISCSWDDEWCYFRFAPNELAIKEVTGLEVNNDTQYHQTNYFWDPYWFYIRANYFKSIDFSEMSQAREAKIDWAAPGTVKVSADNSWLELPIGNNVTNFNFETSYDASIYLPSTGKTYSSASFSAKGNGSGSAELQVPLGKDFEVKVTRNTKTTFTFETGGDVSQSLNEGATQSPSFSTRINRISAAFNQVAGTTQIAWEANDKSEPGEYQVCRTQLNAQGDYVGNREHLGSTKNKSFTDNDSYGMEYGKNYRYEVFWQQDSWSDFKIPTNPEPLTVVDAVEVRTSTMPVVPMHLVQDTTVTDVVKFDWSFGNIPKYENDITFKVHRIEPSGDITRNYKEVVTTRSAGTASFTDDKPASPCALYSYFLQLDLADNKIHLYSDTICAHVLGKSHVKSVYASKGTKGYEVEITWTAQQVGTENTIYDVQRRLIGNKGDWMTIKRMEGTGANYSYTDATAEPGRYYDYRVVAYAPDCDNGSSVISNAMTDVGFSSASGAISGRVQYETGTAVEGARLTLTCESDVKAGQFYHSRAVLEPGNSITLPAKDVVDTGKPFTLQFYVSPARSAEPMTLFETNKKLTLEYNTSSGLYDVKMDGTVVGAIPAGEFSQVSLISNGSQIIPHITGNRKAVNAENVTPQPLPYISTKVYKIYESGASFDGWTLDNKTDIGWALGEGYFTTGYLEVNAYKDFPIPATMVGHAARASVNKSAPWGSRAVNVRVVILGDAESPIATYTICNDNSTHDSWNTYSVEFTIPQGAKTIRYYLTGQDGHTWEGHFGPRFKDMTIAIEGENDGNYVLCPVFTGNIDEVRLWNRALTTEEIDRDADRMIGGETEGLKAYITFDEGLEEHAFDISRTGGVPNSNHAIVGKNTRPSDIIPTAEQLSSYGLSNEKGEYEIRGIPFTGSGTRYSVAPTKGIHQFSPTSRSAFIGGTSLTINNMDFTDVSSFKVTGTIRYAGTTIPVDSVNFYIDGTPCNKNGKMIESDANGEYEISVPIGNHYIEARRIGHTFVNAGRYPAGDGQTYEFLEDTHIDFFDNTLVIFAGRVTGGVTEGKKPLGYGVSQNTIGKAEITLSALDHPQRMLNAIEKVDGTTVTWEPNPEDVPVESSTTDIASVSFRKGGKVNDVKYITITTDEETGEFCAKVPPIRYRVESVTFPNNKELNNDEKFSNIAAIDLTNPRDTVMPDTVYYAPKKLKTLFKCNKKLLLTYRSQPVMDIRQVGAPAGAFGTDTITVRDAGQDIKLPLYTYDEATGKVTYNYGYPIFQTGRTYNFKIKAYEPYVNYDKYKDNGKLYKDALCDSIITFDNELGTAARVSAVDTTANGQTLRRGDLVRLDPEKVPLDSLGEGNYKWIAGLPSLTKPYTRQMNASMVIDNETKLWRRDGLTGVVFGVIPTGNNFITAGPDNVTMVLRDPPGDASSATWATDTITCDYTYTIRGIHNNSEIGVDRPMGYTLDNAVGIATFFKIFFTDVIHDNTALWKYDVNTTWDNHTSVTYTNGQATSTSTSPVYVGRDGDVFIGFSTNYIIGAADKVGLFKRDDGSWGIGMEETITQDEKFKTHFEYTQKYIETTLFDNIKRTRDSKLKHINSQSEIEEDPLTATYYTFLTPDNPKYGSSNNDKEVWGDEAKTGFDGPSYYARFPKGYEGCDSVMWCNEIVQRWKNVLASNEEDKIKAFNTPSAKIGNESFETGVSFTRTTGSSTKEVHNFVETFSTGVAYKGRHGVLLDKAGILLVASTDIGYHQTRYGVDETTTNVRFSYTLNDTQRANAHTVDIYNSTRGWGPIFRTRGGQTRCPYEGETKTKYYRPGLQLDYATMKSDNPKISMPIRNIPDIPAGREAQLQVVLANESQIHEASTSATLLVDPKSNPDGLQISIDGQSLLNGTEFWIDYGQPLTKTITVKQSDNSILDYEDITLYLLSSCGPPFERYGEVKFSVHFVPAAPDVTLKLDKNIVNLLDVENGSQLVATVSDIDRLFTGFKGVRLKYRFAGDSKWTTAHEWLTDEKYYSEGHATETQSLMPTDKPNITYNLQLPDIDGYYYVTAESICQFGGKEYTASTPEQEVVRDTHGPRLIGQASPNNGLLTPIDDIFLRFNETIRKSYLTKDDNFFITGYLNDAYVDHQVSLQLNGNELATEAYLPIANTSFAANMWLKRTSGGTLLEHGTAGNNISLDITDDGRASVTIGDKVMTSTEKIPADRWVFLALNYANKGNDNGNSFTLLLADEDREVMLIDDNAVPNYRGNGRLCVGKDLHGAINELALWDVNRPVHTALAQKDEVVAPYLPGLVGYWRMNEGHGTVVTDYARSRNFILDTERWNLENKSLAAHFDGAHNMAIDIATISPRDTDSFAIDFWFNGQKDKNSGKTLFSVTDKLSVAFNADNSLMLNTYDSKDKTSLDTEGTPIVLSNEDYSDGQWHHFALNVRRGIGAVAYLDGQAVKSIAEHDIPAPAGDKFYVGSMQKRNTPKSSIYDDRFFTGDIDELRIWNASIDGATIMENRYNEIDTVTASGLVVYFPMQAKKLDDAHNLITVFSTDDAAPKSNAGNVGKVTADGITQALSSPPLKAAPVRQNLDYDFVASDNEIHFTIKTTPARMHGNMVTFTVKNVRDIADNISETVTWSARADFKTLYLHADITEFQKDRQMSLPFIAEIYNLGNETEKYTIVGLPTWIEIDRPEGTLNVTGSETLRFNILESAPLGYHTVHIYAINNNGIYCEPIVLHIMVTGNEPNWYVNPGDFESSMNVIGQIYIKDRICTDTHSVIAAFVDDKCCGVASPKLMTSRDAYFVNMTIYGIQDVTTIKNVKFRIFDASQGIVLADVKTELAGKVIDIPYRPNELVGSYDEPVKWMASDRIEQVLNLSTGWNWISLYAQPEEGHSDIESVLGHNRLLNTVKGKEGFAMNSGSKWVSDGLEALAVGNLYKIKVKDDYTLSVSGSRIDTRNTEQIIYHGWNWIGSLSIYNLSLEEAFADFNPVRGDMIKSKTAVAIYDGYKWEGELVAMAPGLGYYFKSTRNESIPFHYPSLVAESSKPAPALRRIKAESQFTPIDHHQFSDNMNVVARLMDGDEELTDLTIAAFVGDECRGVAQATDDGYYLLTIAGNAEEAGAEVSFATEIDGQVVPINEKLVWFSDAIYGDLDDPQIFTLNVSGIDGVRVDGNCITITPTLVRDMINVRSSGTLESVRVHSASGALVEKLEKIDDSKASLNLSHLAAGVYFVIATGTDGGQVTKRIVKQ